MRPLQLILGFYGNAIIFWFIIVPVVIADTIIVDVNGGDDTHRSIQAAIDRAHHGDIVLVRSGIYSGPGNSNIRFCGKAITVRSEKGPNATIIDGQHEGYGFSIVDNNRAETCLDGFTIANTMQGAIKISSSAPLRRLQTPGEQDSGVSLHARPGYYPVTIQNCIISENAYGGILIDCHDKVTLTGCQIIRNEGAGVWSFMSWPTLRHCVVAQNKGTGIKASGVQVINCTVADNEIYGIWADAPMVTMSIVWGNALGSIRISPGGAGSVTYCNLDGLWGHWSNINVSPRFANGRQGDYHLNSQAGRWDSQKEAWVMDEDTSPCIDAGNPRSPIGYESFPHGGIINMGAYGATKEASRSYFGKPACETIVAGDINGDCVVDFKDLAILAFHWLDCIEPGSNQAPEIMIIDPNDHAVMGRYRPDHPISIQVQAYDVDGMIEKVEFFVDGIRADADIGKIGEDLGGRDGWGIDWIWWGQWGHFPEGSYQITAVATDNDGATTVSLPIVVTIHGPK
jgi:hypothetical protein